MAKKSQSTIKPVGIALVVIGVSLIFWGYQMSGSVSSQVTKAITGAASEAVMFRYIAGAVCSAVGLYLFFKK